MYQSFHTSFMEVYLVRQELIISNCAFEDKILLFSLSLKMIHTGALEEIM